MMRHAPTISVHYITEVAVRKKKFDNFKLTEYHFRQADGTALIVEVFCESNEEPIMVDLGVIDVTTLPA